MAETDEETDLAAQVEETPAPTPVASDGGSLWDTAIHLASFKQEPKAHQEWQRLQQRMPNLFGDDGARQWAIFALSD